MQAVICSGATAGKVFLARQQPTARRSSRALVRCQAAGDEEAKFSFSSNKRAALGYTEEDSAGQTNIFAVEPKVYVQGSKADATDSSSTVTLAAGAFVFAMVAVGAGLVVNSAPTEVKDFAPAVDQKALSSYQAQFAAELAQAPALSE